MEKQKYKQEKLEKETQLLAKVEGQTIQPWTKIKESIFIIAFSVLLGTLFYSYIFIEPFDSEYYKSKSFFYKAKDKNTIALKEVKKLTKNTNLYNKYLETSKEKKIAYNDFVSVIGNQKINGFDSLHFFWERFGKNTTSFLFAIWVLYLTLKNANKLNKFVFYGRITIISVFLSTVFFTYFWIFQQFQDFSKPVYYLMTIVSAYLVFIAMNFLFKNKKTKEDQLRAHLMEVAKFSFKNTKPEKREEMLDMIKEIAKNRTIR